MVAEKTPETTVIGADLSKIQPSSIPRNCSFVQLDVEHQDWPFQEKFDYIHFGHVTACFDDTKRVLQRAFASLHPGGWVEMHDSGAAVSSPDGTYAGNTLERYAQLFVHLMESMGRDPYNTRQYARWMRELGFADVYDELAMVPSNLYWAADPHQKELAAMEMQNMMWFLDGVVKPLEQMKWSEEESKRFVAQAQADLQNPDIHLQFPL